MVVPPVRLEPIKRLLAVNRRGTLNAQYASFPLRAAAPKQKEMSFSKTAPAPPLAWMA
jgi:hypothetical protein